MASRRPVIHHRDHEHGGADPVHVTYEKFGSGGGGAPGTLVDRYIAFQKTLASWPSGAWQGPLNFSTATIIRTNDVDGSEMTPGTAANIVGQNFEWDVANPTKLFINTPGLYFVQVGVNIAGTGSDFDVGLVTQAGNSNLFNSYPTTWLRFSSTVAVAAGSGQGSKRITMLDHVIATKNVDLSCWQNSGSDVGTTQAVVIFSYARLRVS